MRGQRAQLFARITQLGLRAFPGGDVFRAPLAILWSAVFPLHCAGVDFHPDQFSIPAAKLEFDPFQDSGSPERA